MTPLEEVIESLDLAITVLARRKQALLDLLDGEDLSSLASQDDGCSHEDVISFAMLGGGGKQRMCRECGEMLGDD